MENSLVKNSIYNIAYKIISVLYPLVAVTYVSHVLMSERMGMVSYAQNIVSYFAIIAALGIPTYGIREIAVDAESKDNRSKTFWELFCVNTISTTCAILVYLGLIFHVNRFYSNLPLYLVAGMQIVLNYINVDWFYQGLEEYKYISIRSVIVKLWALIMLPVLVRKPDDYIKYALIYVLAIAGNNIFNIIRVRKYISKPNRQLEIKKHLKPISILLIVSIAVEIYAMIDTTMLGIFCDDSTVGCYSNAMKLTRMVTTTAAAIGAVLFPRLSKVYKENDLKHFNNLVNKGIMVMLMFAFPATVGMIILKKDIVFLFFGQSFEGAIPILGILSLMIPVVVCNTLMGGQVLVTTGQESKYMISVATASIVNVILNACFIPHYGAPSAAIASLISESIVLILYIFFSKKYVRVHLSARYLVSIAIPLAVYVIVALCLFSKMEMNRIFLIAVHVITCLVLYFGMGLILKNEAMVFAFSKVEKLLLKNRKR